MKSVCRRIYFSICLRRPAKGIIVHSSLKQNPHCALHALTLGNAARQQWSKRAGASSNLSDGILAPGCGFKVAHGMAVARISVETSKSLRVSFYSGTPQFLTASIEFDPHRVFNGS